MATFFRMGCCILVCAGLTRADLSVLETGALGDGKTDCTTAFQQALDKTAAAGGGIVNVPAGQYRINGTLKVPGLVTLQGISRTAPADARDAQGRYQGSVLLAYAGRARPENPPFITLAGRTATLAGLVIAYPERKITEVPPVPYPPAISARSGDNLAVLDCMIVNPYEAIHFDGAARFLIRNVHGYPDFRGLYVDNCYDIGRVENVHFWPFGTNYNPNDPYSKWVNVNAVAFEFARTDWQYVTNTFCFGYGVGYKFSTTKAGSCNGNFLGIGADSCRRAILVEGCQYPGLLITNAELVGRWGSNDSVGIEIAEKSLDSKVSLMNSSFWGPIDRCVWSRSRQTQFTSIGTHYCDWDVGGTGSPAIQIDAGRAIIEANTFREGETHVLVGPKVRSAIIMGNQAVNGLAVTNQAGARTQLVANEADQATLFTDALRSCYRVDVGSVGDQPFISRAHGREHMPHPDEHTMRWTSGNTQLRLPVLPGKPSEIELDVNLPPHAVDPQNGLYLGQIRLATLPDKPYQGIVKATIPTGTQDRVTLTLKVKKWRPVEVQPGSQDGRELGLALYSVTVRAQGATSQPASANTQE
ncbi:MAG TPA: glycosyl hydrolase family 28-related protein [Phycisphaerae bacterium]|nr:glycosyl hydrolase family 28-related protein [Phycisphaerae bacterium]HRY67158.1 glycosyl hydrolase family 28-related protein [Phycisphaerae bacterium]HSA26473.1 glycosyl hydrolase family 28-related protein [Phycisphaerae bacterium]